MDEAAVFEVVADELDSRGYESLVHVPSAHSETYRAVVERHQQHRVTIDGKYPDIVGLSPTDEVVAVEVKGSTDIDRGIGQAITYQRGSHRSFLAADWTEIQPTAKHLSHRGIGVLGVEPDAATISEWIDPIGSGSPQQVHDVRGELISQLRLTGQNRRIGTVALAHPVNFLAPVVALDVAAETELSTDDLLSALESEYGLKRSSSRYCIDGARVLGFISDAPHSLTTQGALAAVTLAGQEITTLSELAATKGSGSVLHETHPAVATLLRNAYLRNPDVELLVEALDAFEGAVRFIDILRQLVTCYPNAFLSIFCTNQAREEARELISQGDAEQIVEQREKWESYMHSNIVQNFVQQLKHVGILTAETPSHSTSLADFDPVATEWELRPVQSW